MGSLIYNLWAINKTIRYIIKKRKFTFRKLVNFGKVNQIHLFTVCHKNCKIFTQTEWFVHPKRKGNSRKFLVSAVAFAQSILNSFTMFPENDNYLTNKYTLYV